MVLLYRIHAWLGLICGVFLLLICGTGAVAIFRADIDRAVDPIRRTAVVSESGELTSLDRLVARLRQDHPRRTITALMLPAGAYSQEDHGNALAVLMRSEQERIQLLVHPYTGEVLGERPEKGTWAQWIRDFHVRLFMGAEGRWFVGALGVLLTLFAVTGVLIFRKWNRGSWKPTIRWGGGARVLIADLHKAVGLLAVPLVILFGISGAVLGLEGLFSWVHRDMRQSLTERTQAFIDEQPDGDLREGILDHSLVRFHSLCPDRIPVSMTPPTRGKPYVTIQYDNPAHHLVKEGAGLAVFDARSGEGRVIYDGRQAGAWGRLYYAMEPLHFGRLGGWLPVKVGFALVGLLLGGLALTGYLIALLRTRMVRALCDALVGQRPAGYSLRRWEGLTRVALVALCVAACCIGLLFAGISLERKNPVQSLLAGLSALPFGLGFGCLIRKSRL